MDAEVPVQHRRRPSPGDRRSLAIAAAALLLAACTATTDETTPAPAPTPADVCSQEPSRPGQDQSLQELLDRAAADGPGGVAAALGRHGEEVRLCSAGRADTAGTPLKPDDAFRVGSITKTFVAVVVLQLVEEGALRLDTLVVDVRPGVPFTEGVTVRQLLNHSSGVPEFLAGEDVEAAIRAEPHRRWTSADVLESLDGRERAFAPGTAHAYSNTNYVIAGMVVEALTGRTVAENVRTRITEPLGLHDTALAPDGREPVTGFSPLFDPSGTTEGTSYLALGTAAGAAGGLISTAGDLAVFYRALGAGKPVRPDLLAEMTVSHGEGYGLGVGTVRLPSGMGFGHFGAIPGYTAQAVVRPASGDVLVVLSNEDDGLRGLSTTRVFHAW
ncbi:serine hydrolase domain-containing protein [Georgenia thermotolerans]|nr:serine hydrolase domain-containing protein [Georgenia thermotolerans]